MSFDKVMRNEFRFRRASSRPRVTKKNSHTVEIYEQMEAIKLGLTDDPRKAVRK
jgi:hypothetical protein